MRKTDKEIAELLIKADKKFVYVHGLDEKMFGGPIFDQYCVIIETALKLVEVNAAEILEYDFQHIIKIIFILFCIGFSRYYAQLRKKIWTSSPQNVIDYARQFDLSHRALAQLNNIDVQNQLIKDEFEQHNDFLRDLQKVFVTTKPNEMPSARALYYMQNMFNTLFVYYEEHTLDGLRIRNLWADHHYS